MKLDGLKFDTPNNTCLSLRMLAELVRAGEVRLDGAILHVDMEGEREKRDFLTLNLSNRS